MKTIIFMLLFPCAAFASCPDFTGRYRVELGENSYVLEYSQVACESLTQKVTYDDGRIFGPFTAVVDGKIKTWRYSRGLAMTVIYRFTPTTFQAVEIHLKDNDVFELSTDSSVRKNVDGSLTIDRRDVHESGTVENTIKQAKKL